MVQNLNFYHFFLGKNTMVKKSEARAAWTQILKLKLITHLSFEDHVCSSCFQFNENLVQCKQCYLRFCEYCFHSVHRKHYNKMDIWCRDYENCNPEKCAHCGKKTCICARHKCKNWTFLNNIDLHKRYFLSFPIDTQRKIFEIMTDIHQTLFNWVEKQIQKLQNLGVEPHYVYLWTEQIKRSHVYQNFWNGI